MFFINLIVILCFTAYLFAGNFGAEGRRRAVYGHFYFLSRVNYYKVMRKFSSLFISFVLLFGVSSCSLSKMIKLSKEQRLAVNPSPLVLQGDRVSARVDANLPTGMLPKGKVYRLDHYYVYGGSEVQLESIEFSYDDYPNNKDVSPARSYDLGFDYEEGQGRGELHIQGVAINPKNGKSKMTDRIKISEGIILTANLVEGIYAVPYVHHGYNDSEELEPTELAFYFNQGSSVLRSTERRGKVGREFNAFLADKNVLRQVEITGMHSPEGPEDINAALAPARAKVVEEFYRNRMDRYDYKGVGSSIRFTVKEVVRDYAPLRAALRDFDIPAASKSEMLRIVGGGGSFEDKELALQKVAGYRDVFRDVYPSLRTSSTRILSVKEKRTKEEIIALARVMSQREGEGTSHVDLSKDGDNSSSTVTDTLSHSELLYAASLSPSLEEKLAIYKSALRYYDSYAAHNNAASVLLAIASFLDEDESARRGLIEHARLHLESAEKKSPNGAEVSGNLAIAYLLLGDVAQGYAHIIRASEGDSHPSSAKRIHAVRGALEVHRGEYDKALRSLGSADRSHPSVLYNHGLVLLLQGDLSGSQRLFEQAITLHATHARAHYALAIVHARLGNEQEVLEGLRNASAQDPSLKERAISDLEFRDYAATLTQL